MREVMEDNGMYIILAAALIGLVWLNIMGKRRQKNAMQFRDTLTAGTKVMTSAGMFGTVVSVSDDRVIIADRAGNESEWLKAAIARIDTESMNATAEGIPESGEVSNSSSSTQRNELRPGSSAPGLLSDDDVRRLGRDT